MKWFERLMLFIVSTIQCPTAPDWYEMWVEATCISILTSAGGYEDILICQKGQVAVKVNLSDEEPASWTEAPPNILFLPGRLPFLFIDFMVGVPQLDLTI